MSDFQAELRELARNGFGAHVLVDPADQSVFDVFREVRADRQPPRPGLWCSNASALRGLIYRPASEAEFMSRIYCAAGRATGDTLTITEATRNGIPTAVRRRPDARQDWYGVLDAVVEGRLDPMPSVGRIIGLDDVPDAIERALPIRGTAPES